MSKVILDYPEGREKLCVCVCVCVCVRAMLGLWITIGKTLIKNSKIEFPDKVFNETERRPRMRKSS